MLLVAGMWFQDLFNYDFRRTEMCIIPLWNPGGGNLLLRLQHGGRHEIFAGGKSVTMSEDQELTVTLPAAVELPVISQAAASGGCGSGGCSS